MHVELMGQGAFQHVKVTLNPGESFTSEAGKMIRMTANVDTDVTTKSKGKGGLLGGLKRMFGGDSLFFSTYTITDGSPGEVFLAPDLVGECAVIEMGAEDTWMCAGGSYMASGPDIGTEPKFQGMKGMFSGESLFFLEVTGHGPCLVNAFGCIRKIEVDGDYIVDSGQVVAFQTSLDYEITKAGSSWIQSFFSGEGVVMKFKGRGTLYVQSHNPSEFGGVLGPLLPERG